MGAISSIAFSVRTASNSNGRPIPLSSAQQLVAAALGYKSLAAYQASGDAFTLVQAEHMVLDRDLLTVRGRELRLPYSNNELGDLIDHAFHERLPSAQLHASDGVLDGFIRNRIDQAVLNSSAASGEMAMTNSDGIREIYLPFSDIALANLPSPGESWSETVEGTITMGIDMERPYVGHRIHVSATLTIVRTGRVSIAEPICSVESARLMWGDEDSYLPQKVSLAEALADELGIDISEADELADTEPQPDESDDGLLYGYIFDFTRDAAPSTAKKLLAKFGSLQIQVQPSFFDRVTMG